MTIESFPVQVSEFVDEVPEPDEATLREFFNKHKDVAYDPSSPDPGFREPKKVDVEYLKAEYESFFDREREAVTQEELEKYYQDHKEEYRQEELPTLDEKPPSEKPEQEKLQEESAEPVTPAPEPEAPTTEEAPSDQQPSTDQGPMTGQDASMGQEASSPAAEKEPAEAGPAAKAPVEKPSPDQQKPAAAEPADKATPGSPDSPDDATSLLRVTSPFRLASFAEEVAEPTQPGGAEEAPAASEVPSNEAAPTEQPEAEPAPPQRPTAEASPTEEPSPEATSSPEPPAEPAQAQAAPAEQPPAGPSPEAESATQGPRSEPQATDSTPSEGPAIPGIAPQEPAYLPLEKVEDEIRRRLARDKANAKIEGLLSDLRNKVTRYHNLLIRFQVDSQTKKGDETVVPPTRPDFAAWAKEYDLIARRTGLISALEAEKLDIGESLVAGRASFVEHVLDLPKNRAEISRDDDGNYYLFWKLDEVEERVAEFDEEGVRERALRVWKMLEARKLAAEEAERVAAVARKAKKPLREVFADRPGIVVTESQFFSWLTYGAIEPWMAYGPPTISDVQGVDTPGHDFMRAVFSLTKGEVGTAMNHPQTAVYVVQVTDGKPLPEVLWSRFLSESYLNYLRASDHDRYLAEKAWLDGIKSDVGFRWDAEWQRQASQRRQEA